MFSPAQPGGAENKPSKPALAEPCPTKGN